MKTKTTLFALAGAILIALGITAIVLINQPAKRVDKTVGAQQSAIQGETSDVIRFTATRGRSVLDQFKEHAKVETKNSDFGVYVDAVNGLRGGTNNKYWMYYVNGELANIGAADYITVGGEIIEWRFE